MSNATATATVEAPSTIGEFITRNDIKMRVTPIDRNPSMDDDTWARAASHWRCTIRCGVRRMVLAFSRGSAHTGPPTLADVLDYLASDAAGYLNTRDYADWCADLGYDTDSRKAERTFKAVARQTAALERVLGRADMETLLWKVERL